jgi:putative Holliday junction resolvase
MRILGIDYGSKRIGIAVSDEEASFAIPRTVLPNDAKILDEIDRLLIGEGVSKIVIGDPGDNQISSEVKSFVTKLEEKFSLPVILEKEFMTSMHVSQFQGRKPIARLEKQDQSPKRDDSAAALILQRYLDRKI